MEGKGGYDMKLLFVCGANVADGALSCAPWIKSLAANLSDEFELTLATYKAEPAEPVSLSVGARTATLCGCSKLINSQNGLAPYDAIVLFGTEKPYTRDVLRVCKSRGLLDKTAVFAQGVLYPCALHYAEGVPARVIKRYTFRDLLRRQNIKREQKILLRRAEAEREALALTKNFIGRTTMDKAILRLYNQNAEYYRCNDVLRDPFYEGRWNLASCEKHRIFVSQFYYPLKGFHYLIEAANLLKGKYPDLKIAAAGYNPIQKPLPQKELKDSSYIRYIKELIKRYGLSENIVLLGTLSEERMKEEYLKANVFVMPSTIENSPNSLAEAMALGVPTVASDVGGVTDFAQHKTEAYIYPSSAVYLLANYIDSVFSDREKTEAMARSGRARALREYDRRRNIAAFENTLKSIAQKHD